jgi:CRP-like cAMP-binding protein
MALVLKDLRVEQFSRRENILQKGSFPDSLLFLLVGQMQVVDVTEDGREIGLRILSPGNFFGEIAVITGSPRTASVVSITNVVVAFMPRELALLLFSHSPSIANKMIHMLAEKIAKDSELRGMLSIQNASKRVFALLESLKTSRVSGEVVIERLPTHQEIAIMVNTSRETVTRALIHLGQLGIIKKSAHSVTILKPDALHQLLQNT